MRRGTRWASGLGLLGTHGFEQAVVFLSVHPLITAAGGGGGSTLLALKPGAHFENVDSGFPSPQMTHSTDRYLLELCGLWQASSPLCASDPHQFKGDKDTPK